MIIFEVIFHPFVFYILKNLRIKVASYMMNTMSLSETKQNVVSLLIYGLKNGASIDSVYEVSNEYTEIS